MKKRLVPAVMVIMLLIGVIHTVFTEGSPMEEIIIQSPNGNVFGVLRLPEEKTPVPLIILSHGFGGNHSLDLDSAAYFNKAGFATFSLDFCGGGFNSRSSGTMLDMSVLTEAADLDAVSGAGVPGHRAAGRFGKTEAAGRDVPGNQQHHGFQDQPEI